MTDTSANAWVSSTHRPMGFPEFVVIVAAIMALNPLALEWIDSFLPQSIRRAKIKRRLEEQVEGLVIRNVENLRWATLQNLNATFRQFEAGLKEQLDLTLAATRGAIEAVWEKRRSKAGDMAAEVGRYKAAETKLAAIGRELSVR